MCVVINDFSTDFAVFVFCSYVLDITANWLYFWIKLVSYLFF